MACMEVGLIPQRVLLFCFFGAMGALLPFLPLHMRSAGLSMDEARIVSMVAPAVSLLGPLAVGPLADRLTSGLWGQGCKDGGLKDYTGRAKGYRRLRALLAILILLSAFAYCLLLLVVPVVTRRDARTPTVTFQCSSSLSGGVIVQEMCADQCHNWGGAVRGGSLMLSDCRYDCKELPEAAKSVENDLRTTEEAPTTESPFVHPMEASDDDYDAEEPPERSAEEVALPLDGGMSALALHGSPTHLCFSGDDEPADCHVFHDPENNLDINATMDGTVIGLDNMCVFPLASFGLKSKVYSRLSCRPSAMGQCRVLCSVHQPINEEDSGPSLLGPSGPCPVLLGDPTLTFWSYLVVRSVADCFPVASLAVLGAAMLLPSLHTHPGRQLASGALGAAIAGPIAALFLAMVQPEHATFLPNPWPPFAVFSVLAVVSVVLLLTFQVPLLLGESPVVTSRKNPWLGAYPPAKASAHTSEAAALFIILVLLGIFWGGLDSYCPWYLSDLMTISSEAAAENFTMATNETVAGTDWSTMGSWSPAPLPILPFLLLLGLMMTTAALPAVPLLWHAERLIEICGHANLLIIAFTFYIAHYAVLSFIHDGWWVLISEAFMAPFSMVLAWATAVHYVHLLFPPRWSATAQASAVIAHFCVGRCLGAVFGGLTWAAVGYKVFLQGGTILAAVVASLYFLVYHFCLKARCIGGAHRQATAKADDERPPGPTTNGNYTPLRVYHNGMGDANKNRY